MLTEELLQTDCTIDTETCFKQGLTNYAISLTYNNAVRGPRTPTPQKKFDTIWKENFFFQNSAMT
jgi:hypothetical protein